MLRQAQQLQQTAVQLQLQAAAAGVCLQMQVAADHAAQAPHQQA